MGGNWYTHGLCMLGIVNWVFVHSIIVKGLHLLPSSSICTQTYIRSLARAHAHIHTHKSIYICRYVIISICEVGCLHSPPLPIFYYIEHIGSFVKRNFIVVIHPSSSSHVLLLCYSVVIARCYWCYCGFCLHLIIKTNVKIRTFQ